MFDCFIERKRKEKEKKKSRISAMNIKSKHTLSSKLGQLLQIVLEREVNQ